MARKQAYLPFDEPGMVLWLNNFAAKFPAYAPLFGFVGADVAAVTADKNMWAYIVNIISQNKADMIEFTGYKDLLKKGPSTESTAVFPVFTGGGAVPPVVPADIFGRIGKMVQTIKNHTGYTTAIGGDLKIIGPESTFNPDTFKTVLKATVFPGKVRIDYVKEETQGVNMYGKLASETNWTFLGMDPESPFDDMRPLQNPAQPEQRQYRAQGVFNNLPIGQFSEIVTVNFGG